MNHGVTRGERGEDVADAEGERIIPRGNEPNDAERVILRARRGEHRQGAAVALVAQGVGGALTIEARAIVEVHDLVIGVGAGLAVFGLDEVKDGVLVLAQSLVEAEEHAAALGEARVAPDLLCGAGVRDCGLDVGCGRGGESKEFLAGPGGYRDVRGAGAAHVASRCGVEDRAQASGEFSGKRGRAKGFHKFPY